MKVFVSCWPAMHFFLFLFFLCVCMCVITDSRDQIENSSSHVMTPMDFACWSVKSKVFIGCSTDKTK